MFLMITFQLSESGVSYIVRRFSTNGSSSGRSISGCSLSQTSQKTFSDMDNQDDTNMAISLCRKSHGLVVLSATITIVW